MKEKKLKENNSNTPRLFGAAASYKYSSSISMLDFLFNSLLMITVLFILTFLLINPKANKKVLIIPTDLMVTMEWPDSKGEMIGDDVDLFIQTPSKQIVYFGQIEVPGIHLDHDDLGNTSDTVTEESGKVTQNFKNWETAAIRTLVTGEYVINALMYKKASYSETPVKISVERVQPYELIYEGTKIFKNSGDEETFVKLTVDAKKKIKVSRNYKISLKEKTDTHTRQSEGN